ncbi:hypothetical protein ES705_23713 [subsurface metagenome]
MREYKIKVRDRQRGGKSSNYKIQEKIYKVDSHKEVVRWNAQKYAI